MKTIKNVSVVLNVILAVALAVVFVQMSKEQHEHAEVRKQYIDSLSYYEKLTQANLLFLSNDIEGAIHLYNEVDALAINEHQWTRYALNILGRQDSLQGVLSSQNTRAFRLQDSIDLQEKNMMRIALENSDLHDELQTTREESLTLAQDLEKMTAKVDELTASLEKSKESYGQLTFTNNQQKSIRYFGEIEDGKANGYGIGIVDGKGIYEGYWRNNVRHGQGKYRWANGDSYEGNFTYGNKDGFGIYTFVTGERYEGHWKNDLREGKGKIYSIEGKLIADGTWKNDKFVKSPTEDRDDS